MIYVIFNFFQRTVLVVVLEIDNLSRNCNLCIYILNTKRNKDGNLVRTNKDNKHELYEVNEIFKFN